RPHPALAEALQQAEVAQSLEREPGFTRPPWARRRVGLRTDDPVQRLDPLPQRRAGARVPREEHLRVLRAPLERRVEVVVVQIGVGPVASRLVHGAENTPRCLTQTFRIRASETSKRESL